MPFVYPRNSVCAAAVSLAALTACGDLEPNGLVIELAPEVISSIDGTTTARVIVVDERTPVSGADVDVTVTYTDRNGVAHEIMPASATTDDRGAAEVVLTGLDWEGTGTVTAEIAPGSGITASATFSVLDRTPPTVEILPPTEDLHVGAGFPVQVQVRVQDEIGVSEVFFEATGEVDRTRSSLVASGATDATVDFEIDIPEDAAAGPTITLYAMAADMSGNLAAAEPVTLIVDPLQAIGTPPGLTGMLLTDGTAQFLEEPRALAVSPMDGQIYVADNSGGTPCEGGCIRKVAPDTGLVEAGVVVLVNGTAEGIAFDATGENLYYSDQQNRIGRLTWSDANSQYQDPVLCNDLGAEDPRAPYHLVLDPDLGVMVTDGETRRIKRLADCAGNQPTDFTAEDFEEPRGIAIGPAGEFYASDRNDGVIRLVDRDTGDTSVFEQQGLDQPYGIEWLAGGASGFADSLMVADLEAHRVVSTTGTGIDVASYLRAPPIDVAIEGTTMYILTQPEGGDRGRIFAVTGL